MNFKPLNQVPRRDVSTLAALRTEGAEGMQAGVKLANEAKSFGLDMRGFLDLAIDVRGSETADQFRTANGHLGGYEATLSVLGLPVRDNFNSGHVLDAASDTFQTYPGTRALFPEVIDDVIQWKYRQPQLENIDALVSQSRTINGVELVSTVVDDKEGDYQNHNIVAEMGRVATKTIRTGEQAVKFWKHGGGLRISYEFERRARLDMLTPYGVRQNRETERSKVVVATSYLINGDGLNPAAAVVPQSTMDSTAVAGKISYKGLLKFLVERAKAGTPVDTVLGNWDAYIEWLMMFAVPTSNMSRTDAQNLAATGFQIGGVPILTGTVNFALSSGMPANQLLGYSKGDTLEELVEAGSNIDESLRAVQNQTISYIKTVNSGYKLAFPDTRAIYNYGA